MLTLHASRTTAGPVREINEDSIAKWPPEGDRRGQNFGQAWILADGVGGGARGEVASQLAVQTTLEILERTAEDVPAPTLLRHIFEGACKAIYDANLSPPTPGRMSTTLVVSFIQQDVLHVAHVGDSRAYLVRQGVIKQLTSDHCYVAPSVKLRLAHEHQAMTDPRRSQLTRSVGAEPVARYDISRTALTRGDIVVLCSDGLYGFVTAEEIRDVVTHLTPEESCRYLVSLAEKRQLDDNLSVQVIKVQELDPIAYRQGVPVYRREAPTSMSEELEPGHVLDNRFEISELISKSGMASIFRARDAESGEQVAIKIPHMQFESDVATFTRFQREEEIGQQLAHPFILKIHPVPSEKKSRPYLAMEYLEGKTLDKVMQETKPLPEAEAVKICSRICAALAYMHERSVVHRDLKPQNIMICNDHSIRIIDFGIAKAARMRRLTFAGFSPMMGTPDYMAPEQVNGRRGDHRTDIYSLGAILYEMLTGKVPFEGESPYVTMNLRTTGDPVAPRKQNPQLSEAIEEITLHALARRPEDRYDNAGDMKAELNDYSLVKLTGRHERLQANQAWRRRSLMIPLLAGFFLLQLAFFGAMFWYFTRVKH